MRRLPLSWLLAGPAIGAATMYLLDPARGKRRRHGIEDRLRSAAHDVEDVAGKAQRDVHNRMRGVVARVRGSRPTRPVQRRFMSQGTPERRIAEGGVGALAALWGLARGGLAGIGGLVGGGYLLACAGVPRQQGAIVVQKTLTVDVPIEQVFEFWSRFENFPRFMEHVIEVGSIGGSSHWRVKGPMGAIVEWNAEITKLVPNRVIAWQSIAGSTVRHHGEVHFERIGDRATRISIHMAYAPPGGPLGHAVAGFLLGDPKTLMDDDLLRLKTLLESGKTTVHSHEVHADELH